MLPSYRSGTVPMQPLLRRSASRDDPKQEAAQHRAVAAQDVEHRNHLAPVPSSLSTSRW